MQNRNGPEKEKNINIVDLINKKSVSSQILFKE